MNDATFDKTMDNLRAAPENDPLLTAFLTVIDEQFRDEQLNALLPNLSADARHFNCGRAAAIFDLREKINSIRENLG